MKLISLEIIEEEYGCHFIFLSLGDIALGYVWIAVVLLSSYRLALASYSQK